MFAATLIFVVYTTCMQIINRACDEAPGCGKWEKPLIANPAYKGKWSAPKVDNPDYKGKWKPRKIAVRIIMENPYRVHPLVHWSLDFVPFWLGWFRLAWDIWTGCFIYRFLTLPGAFASSRVRVCAVCLTCKQRQHQAVFDLLLTLVPLVLRVVAIVIIVVVAVVFRASVSYRKNCYRRNVADDNATTTPMPIDMPPPLVVS